MTIREMIAQLQALAEEHEQGMDAMVYIMDEEGYHEEPSIGYEPFSEDDAIFIW